MKALLAAVALAFGLAAPALADTPAAPAKCETVKETLSAIAKAGLIPTKLISGPQAAKIGKALGADFEASDIIIYVKDDTVLVMAYVKGCFQGAARGSVDEFNARVPGVLATRAKQSWEPALIDKTLGQSIEESVRGEQ